MRGRKTNLATVRGQLDERGRRERDVLVAFIVGPTENGFWNVHDPLTNETRIVSSGQGNVSYRPGAAVLLGMPGTANERRTILSLPPAGLQGAANFAFPTPTGAEHDRVGIASASPNFIYRGTTELVTLTGFGFLEDPLDEFRAVVYNATTRVWDADPLVTLGDVTWVSFTSVTVPISVVWGAPAGYAIALEVTRA